MRSYSYSQISSYIISIAERKSKMDKDFRKWWMILPLVEKVIKEKLGKIWDNDKGKWVDNGNKKT